MKALKTILTFCKDNFWIVLFAAGMLALFLFTGHFGSIIFSAMKFSFVVLLAGIFIHWKFPATIHKWITESGLIADWNALDAKHRVYVGMGMLAVLFIVCGFCFVGS